MKRLNFDRKVAKITLVRSREFAALYHRFSEVFWGTVSAPKENDAAGLPKGLPMSTVWALK